MVKPYGQQIYDSCVLAGKVTCIGASAGLALGATYGRYKMWETCSAIQNETFCDITMPIQFRDLHILPIFSARILAGLVVGGGVGIGFGLSTIARTILFPDT